MVAATALHLHITHLFFCGVSYFLIGHRGSSLLFTEHTETGRMGAGIIECDVTFTKDLELVCRHSQCDLHTTTNVVTIPELNAKCTTPWSPGVEPTCCTSDFTLEEIKMLCAKMDSSNDVSAPGPHGYAFDGTPSWRTDLYQYGCPQVHTHRESIEIISSMGRKFTPELKHPIVPMPFNGFSQSDFAQKLVDEYKSYGVSPNDIFESKARCLKTSHTWLPIQSMAVKLPCSTLKTTVLEAKIAPGW